MSNKILGRRIRTAGLLVLWPGLVGAQEHGSLIGTVFDGYAGTPVEGVVVLLRESGLRTTTEEDGRFAFTAVPAGTWTLRLERDGYVSLVESVEVTPLEIALVQLDLHPVGAVLDELRVLAGRGPPREGGSSEAEIVDRGDGALTAADLLIRRVPGLTVSRTDGSMGAGLRVRLRGTSSISLSDRPAVYLDGVRIGDGGSLDMDVLDQIRAADVRRIRILRGPAAASRYPLSAAGVILIETRGTGEG